MTRIELTISPDGQTKIETTGFEGGQCRQASRFLEQALGRTIAEQLTGEFYAGQPLNEQQREQT